MGAASVADGLAVGRRIPDESEIRAFGYAGPDFARRRQVLRETLAKFQTPQEATRLRAQAAFNHERWSVRAAASTPGDSVRVIRGDWGDVTLALSRRYGTRFAVLNMANAYVAGGAYVEGAPAQEENMYRRTDCHFFVSHDDFDPELDRYRPEMTDLINASNGRVYLDTDQPRTCIRGPEDRTRDDLGYKWLRDEELFSFYELKAAAQDLRGGVAFDAADARRRIAAQLDTLIQKGVRHAVLGASGCGAFRNPPEEVARIYAQEIQKRAGHYDVIAFAIFHSGYGPDNYVPFENAMRDLDLLDTAR